MLIFACLWRIEKDIIGFCESDGKFTLQLLSSDENSKCASGPSIYKLGAFACRNYFTGHTSFSKIVLNHQ